MPVAALHFSVHNATSCHLKSTHRVAAASSGAIIRAFNSFAYNSPSPGKSNRDTSQESCFLASAHRAPKGCYPFYLLYYALASLVHLYGRYAIHDSQTKYTAVGHFGQWPCCSAERSRMSCG